MQTILDKVTHADVVLTPFPHLVLENALDESLYKRLADSFPLHCLPVAEGSNIYTYYKASKALRERKIDGIWLEFIKIHTSQVFLSKILTIFGDTLRNLHPDLENRLGKKLEQLKPKVRDLNLINFRQLSLDCQFAQCSPVTQFARAVRSPGNDAGPHIDRPVALYAGLLYFRLPGDNSGGGDLRLYKYVSQQLEYDRSNHVPESKAECFRTIRYAQNTVVFFLNSPYSIHGVSPREVTQYSRLHVNFLGEFPFPVFDIEPWRKQNIE